MWKRLVVFLGIIAVAEYYSYVVVRSAVRMAPQYWRNALMALYLLVTVLSWLGLFFFRQIQGSEMPGFLRNLYIAGMMGIFVGKMLIAVMMLVDELRRLALWIWRFFNPAAPSLSVPASGTGIPRSVFISRMALLAGITSVSSFIYGIGNRYRYRVRRIRIRHEDLPAAFRGLKIVQLSDIHSGSFDNPEAVMQGVQRALDEKPDLILFTGDLVNSRADEMAGYEEIFSRLKAPMGVYSVLGNHDYGDYVSWESPEAKARNLEHLKRIQEEMGWKLLMNEHVILERDGASIALIGIENWGAKAGFPKYGNMQRAWQGLPEKNIPFRILLSHDPSHWDAQVRPEYPGVQLTLSGHTHGMQFGVEIPGLKWSPVQYIYKKWAGLYREGNQYLYVNRGFGFIGYPGRLGILPEITVIELE